MANQDLLVERFNSQTNVVHVPCIRSRSGPAWESEASCHIDQVDQGASGAKVNKPQVWPAALDGAPENCLVEVNASVHVADSKYDMVDAADAKRDHARGVRVGGA